jgi:hypothetical protein
LRTSSGQVVTVQLNQVEDVQKHVVAVVAQPIKARHSIVAARHRLAVEDRAGAQARHCRDDQREPMAQIVAWTAIARRPSLRAMMRKPSCLISCGHS